MPADAHQPSASDTLLDEGAVANGEIDRASPVPLYHQVYGALVQDIRDGRLSRGDTLPKEAEIGRRFGVSRITVRQALTDLVRAGHVAREKPRGPLVIKSAPIEQRLSRLTSFFIADALDQGYHPQFVCLSAQRMAVGELAATIPLPADEYVTRVDRLLVDRSGPLAAITSYVPERCCPDLMRHDLNGSLVTLMEEAYGLRMFRGTQWISARVAGEAERKLLGLEPRMAVVVIRRLKYAEDGQVIEYFECVLRADRYEFVMDLTRDQEHREPER